MMFVSTHRLLQDRDSGQPFEKGEGQKGIGRALGPPEISISTRYGILAGMYISLSEPLCPVEPELA